MLKDEVAGLSFPQDPAYPEKIKRIDIPEVRIGKYVQQTIPFRQTRIIFFSGYTGNLVIPRKIFIEYRDSFLSPGPGGKKWIGNEGNNVHVL